MRAFLIFLLSLAGLWSEEPYRAVDFDEPIRFSLRNAIIPFAEPPAPLVQQIDAWCAQRGYIPWKNHNYPEGHTIMYSLKNEDDVAQRPYLIIVEYGQAITVSTKGWAKDGKYTGHNNVMAFDLILAIKAMSNEAKKALQP